MKPGTRVVIIGLAKAPQYNNKPASVESFDAATGRFKVRLKDVASTFSDSGTTTATTATTATTTKTKAKSKMLAVRRENLRVDDSSDDGSVPGDTPKSKSEVQYVLTSDPSDPTKFTAVFNVPEGMAEALVQNPILANGSQFDLEVGPKGSNTIRSSFASSDPEATAEAIKKRLIGRVADPTPPGMDSCAQQ